MNKRQINKTRMYFATDLVLDNHHDLIEPFPELTSAQQRLKAKLALIEDYRMIQEANNSGLTVSKSIFRDELNKLIHQFSSALLAHGTVVKDNELIKKATYNNTSLLRAADPILYDIGLLMYKMADPLRNELSRFFITDNEFNALNNVLASFRNSIPQKRVATGTSKVSTGNISDTFDAIDMLLKKEIDVLIMPFQFTQINFYNEYKSARIIVETGGNRKKADDDPNDPKE